jgi:osmotically-inducible protein OsmY
MPRWLFPLVVVGLLACRHAVGSTAMVAIPGEDVIPDVAVAGALQRDILNDPVLRSEAIRVSVANGQVRLAGSVGSLSSKRRAARLVAGHEGARALDNGIVVEAPARPDEVIGADVTDAIRRDPATRTADVKATASGATVTIAGSVDSSTQREDLSEVASRVPGVKDIVLEVSLPPAYRRDSEIAGDVRHRLDEDARLDARYVAIAANKRTVALSGIVPSLFQHDAAVADAWVPGVAGVDAYRLRVDRPGYERARAAADHRTPGR